MPNKLIHSVDEAITKLENYCVYRERCHKEVEQKLKDMKMIPQAREIIILHLLENDFLNEERYAKSFARGKFKIKKWGKNRIIKELKFKGISNYNINSGIAEITEQQYLDAFHKLAENRFSSIKETNRNKKKKKLFDYLVYRGWETQLIYQKINELFN